MMIFRNRSYRPLLLAWFTLVMTSPMVLVGQVREKTFVQTDRTTYLSGETVWFSIFCTEGGTNRPSGLSKLAYIEVNGPGKNATLRAKVVLTNGNGNGYLNIPSYLPSGNYTLRGWTNWMRNFPGEGYYTGTLTIINPTRKPEAPQSVALRSPLAGFYPEGGQLVEGLESTVGCHITDPEGNGLIAYGAVVKNGNDTISRFGTSAHGFGRFLLRPDPGASYSVYISSSGGRTGTYPLAAASRSGYVLSVSGASGKLIARTEATTDLPRESLTLVLIRDGRTFAAWKGINGPKGMSWPIPVDSMPAGLSRLVLFNQAGEPLAERAVFRRPSSQSLSLGITTDHPAYSNRKPVDLTVTTQVIGGAVSPATVSLSVFKTDELEDRPVERIEQWLSLGAYLRGRVQDLPWYFSDSAGYEATDLLLLTQGWTSLRQIESEAPVLRFVPEYAGHLITGTVTRRTDGRPLMGIPTYLSVQGKRFHFSSAVSDSAGRVSFDLRKIYGNGSLIVQTGVDSTAHLELDDPWKTDLPAVPATPLRVAPSLSESLRKAVLYQRTGQRTPDKDRFYFPDAVDSLPFFGQAEKTYLLDDYTRFRTMDEIFREYIPEVQVKRAKGSYELRVDHAPLPEFFTTDPLMLLDGVPYFNTDEVMNFDPLKIRRIDIVNRHFYQGSLDYSGIISMTSYDGDGGGMPLNPNAVLIEYEGLQLRREFPAPEYATPEQLSSRQPDFRRLLHWAPGVWTGEKGKAEIRFYTGDDKGKYLIVAQGLADDGSVGSSISEIVVK